MRSTLAAMEASSSELLQFTASIGPVTHALTASGDASIRQYLSIRRRFDYAALVVSLYAAFESFVEDLIWSFSEAEVTFRSYLELPQGLQKKHLVKSADLLARGRLGEGRYAGLTDRDVVSGLHTCLTGIAPYSLNRAAVVHHDNNLKHGVLTSIFTDVGIDAVHSRAGSTDALIQWYQAHPDNAGRIVAGVPASVIELRLNNLVDRRNEIAHGNVPNAALGPDEMADLVEFVASYARALFAVVIKEYLKRRYLETQPALGLGRSLEGLKLKDTVAVLATPGVTITAKQPAFSVVNGDVHRWGTIESLMLNDAPVTEAGGPEAPAGTVGVRMSFRLTDSAEVYVLTAPDPRVWS